MRGLCPWLLGASLLATPAAVSGGEYPVRPYVDPSQLDVPFPKHSHRMQPWRAFLETRSGHDFVRGVGINYNAPGNDELAVRLLAEAGFRAFRIEVGWGTVRWEEDGLADGPRLRGLLRLCRRFHVRPTFLLNAHEGVPCPTRSLPGRLAAGAPK